MHRILPALLAALAFVLMPASIQAAGTLTPVGSSQTPISIRDHSVSVVLNNGFAQTEVEQTFFNPNDQDVEAFYSFPLPKSASLSELTIFAGESEIHGEVLEKNEALRVYEEERDQGNDAGLASKNSYKTFDFLVSRVPANGETRIRFVYYQPLEIDTGVGRYVYPLQDGGTDDAAASFWMPNTKVDGTISVEVELKSAWPVEGVRVPGFESEAIVDEIDSGSHFQVRLEHQDASLDRDFVLYYRLADNLPGRAELIPYKAEGSKPGTFMLVVTPGVDLQPLNRGADYVFVLDVSGSMEGKLFTLTDGIRRALGELSGEDRFRIVTFNDRARALSRDWVTATPDNVHRALEQVGGLRAGGSTNLFDGLQLALKSLDDDRATSLVLVTDAVTNTGVLEPAEFHRLMKQYDVRAFGFLLGNNSNWPLMRAVCDASGGFWAQISNQDDLLGQIMLAKSKMTHEALHDVEFEISGVKTFETTEANIGKLYRGQQLVIFGRYAEGGKGKLRLKARMTGEDKSYGTSFDLPDVDTDNPELERLWALNRIEALELKEATGQMVSSEAEGAILDLGLEYQLVTDYTSMVVLRDEAFDARGIDRRNQRRVALERQAQANRRQQPARDRRADSSAPMFPSTAPSTGGGGGGGGAFDPWTVAVALFLISIAWVTRQRRTS